MKNAKRAQKIFFETSTKNRMIQFNISLSRNTAQRKKKLVIAWGHQLIYKLCKQRISQLYTYNTDILKKSETKSEEWRQVSRYINP